MIVSAEIDDDIVKQIDEIAKVEDRTRSNIIRILVKEALEGRKGEKK